MRRLVYSSLIGLGPERLTSKRFNGVDPSLAFVAASAGWQHPLRLSTLRKSRLPTASFVIEVTIEPNAHAKIVLLPTVPI